MEYSITTENVTTTGDGLQVIDLLFQGRKRAIASYLLMDGNEAALVEAGPGSTLSNLLDALSAAGVAPEQVTKLLLTHIHLDHAGATGSLVQQLPNAIVYVHEIGAPHLIDPSKLLRSASRIYGDQMASLWGAVLAVPEERVVQLQDGDRIPVPGGELEALYTPGHASHHVAFWNAQTREVFTGDVGGVWLPGTERVMPPTPPPDLDLEAWSASIDRLLELAPQTLYLTHFGPAHDPHRHLEELRTRLYDWGELIEGELRSGTGEPEIAARLEAHANEALATTVEDPELRASFRLVSGYEMNVAGYVRYFKKRDKG